MALKTVFQEGLNHELQAELAYKNETMDLSQFIKMANKLDNLIRNKPWCKQPKMAPASMDNAVPSAPQPTEPTQIVYARV